MSSNFVNKSILVVHGEAQSKSRITSLVRTISKELDIQEAETSQDAIGELSHRPCDLMIVEFGDGKVDRKTFFESFEDLPESEHPKSTIVIGNIIDQNYHELEIQNLTYLRKAFLDKELAALIKNLLGIAEKKTIDAGFIIPFIEGTVSVLQTMSQITPVKEKLFIKEEAFPSHISSVAGLVSPHFRGSLAISFEETCFLGIVSQMLGEKFATITPEIHDAAAEICNQVLGFAKTKLNEIGHEIEMTIPSIICAPNHRIPHTVQGACLGVRFRTDFGSFILETRVL